MDRVFQMAFTDSNPKNGYPRKLVFVYEIVESKANLVELYQCANGTPNITLKLREDNVPEMLELYIKETEYKAAIRTYKDILKDDI